MFAEVFAGRSDYFWLGAAQERVGGFLQGDRGGQGRPVIFTEPFDILESLLQGFIVWLHCQRKVKVREGVFMSAEHLCLIRKVGQAREGVMHLLCRALEQATTSTREQGIAVDDYRLELDKVESNGYAFQIEMSFRAWKKGFRLKEIPIMFVDRDIGESKMSKRIVREAVWRVWRLRWLAVTGRL